MTMIAEVTNASDAFTFWQLLQIGSFLSGIVCPIMMVIYMRSDKKQRREVSFEFEPVGKQEFKEHVNHNTQRHAELFRGIDNAKLKCAQEMTQSVKALENKVDENYKEITEKLRTLPIEIVALFRNSKGLL